MAASRPQALGAADFRRVFRTGRRVSTEQLMVHAAKRPGGGPGRYGLAVSKKSGGAVVRNRIRRQVRAAVRQAGGVPVDIDLVIVPRAGATLRVDEMAAQLRQIMEGMQAQNAR